MTDTIIPAAPCPSLAVTGDARAFPIRHVYCVGRNYAAHAREMGHDPDREPPFFFTKAADQVVPPGTIPYPPRTADLHHEIELVVAIGTEGSEVTPEQAREMIFGYAVGVDLTRRDLQGGYKKMGRPWDLAKQFSAAAPCAPLRTVADVGHPRNGAITFAVDGEPRQSGDLADMIWSIDELMAELSTYDTLRPGDLIYTGTPAGVGAIGRGQTGEGLVEGVGEIRIEIT